MQTVTEVRAALRAGAPVRSLASLVRVAIEDGREMLASGKAEPDFRWFYMRHRGGDCTACLAGSVMLGTLREKGEFQPEGYADLFDRYRQTTAWALLALDAVRRGALVMAYRRLEDGDDDDRHEATPVEQVAQGYERAKAGAVVAESSFNDRETFTRHLASLVGLAADLEEIEAAVAAAPEGGNK
ncbi:MAG: hypothetical protein F4139_00695 [Gemmatimonadetes bacterium]|nr:hypothetical protein [Gemmatimonadota bacterium]MYA65608.1 hypothetical protein [Gemmatimonadota bacterium]MYB99510.1 hypothetical protein [Gemmatimonadota bacterium]MYH51446.1 hypothetical protein [Gemmatimonadota bacterium]MYI47041.1 hypothetical protein [Gemmatimonadota bacterium]